MSEINIKLKLNSDDLKRGAAEAQGSVEKLKTSFIKKTPTKRSEK